MCEVLMCWGVGVLMFEGEEIVGDDGSFGGSSLGVVNCNHCVEVTLSAYNSFLLIDIKNTIPMIKYTASPRALYRMEPVS